MSEHTFTTSFTVERGAVVNMRLASTLITLSVLGASPAVSQAVQETRRVEALLRDLEIELALSALPPHLRDSATVCVLNPAKGFEVAAQGHEWLPRAGRSHRRRHIPRCVAAAGV